MSTSKKFVYIAAIVTIFGLGGIGLTLSYFFHDQSPKEILFSGINPFQQFLFGSAYALIAVFVLLILLERKLLDSTRYFFSGLIKKFRVSTFEIFLLSACAGIGEEILFRGAIQPWLGIWLTSLIFIFLHGYLNPMDRPLFIYGILLFVVSAGFGYLMQKFGLITAVTAHFWIDVVLMIYLKKQNTTGTGEPSL